MREIGILGGSFNPVHTGHLMVASYIRQIAGLDEVWLSLSPANPLKQSLVQASDADRMSMLRLALDEASRLKAVDYELQLPRPSYTIDYLRHLKTQFCNCRFRLIIGSDNWLIFNRWKESDAILDEFGVIVYPRPGYEISRIDDSRGRLINAPGIDISSTFIRNAVEKGLDMNFYLPREVYNYIKTNNLYHDKQ